MQKILVAILCCLGLATAAIAGRQDFVIVNNTGYTIEQVYVSPTSAADWQEDVLGRDILEAGNRVTIHFDRSEDACLWDLMAVYSDGERAEWQGFNLCEVSVIVLHYDERTGETSAEYE